MKVLICEDDLMMSNMLQEFFEAEGIEVLQAHTMAEARTMIDSDQEITVVTMDGEMPLAPGQVKSLTDMLVEHILQRRPDLRGRVIAIAGEAHLRDRLLAAGATGIPGRRQYEEAGVFKPSVKPAIQAVIKVCKG